MQITAHVFIQWSFKVTVNQFNVTLFERQISNFPHDRRDGST